ncbi:MAG: hypothetical protein DCC58_11595 [Chloroflexi bacterium]|nr:MAG: hypothetical protein DCC58_11595 [Chloroflexota bacterium]
MPPTTVPTTQLHATVTPSLGSVGATEAPANPTGGLMLVWSEQAQASNTDTGFDWWRILGTLAGAGALVQGIRGLRETGWFARA